MSARRATQRPEGQPSEAEGAGLRTCQSRRLRPRPAPPRSPCCSAAESPRTGSQSRRPPAGRACRLARRASRSWARRASVAARRGGRARGELPGTRDRVASGARDAEPRPRPASGGTPAGVTARRPLPDVDIQRTRGLRRVREKVNPA